MSKQLYVEALADLRATREAVTADAKRALVEALAPRIQNLVEKALMNDLSQDLTEDEEILVDDGTSDVDASLSDDVTSTGMSTADIMSTKVSSPSFDEEAFESRLAKVESEAADLKGASKRLRENRAFGNVLSQTISELDDMYGYVQENVSDPERKTAYESRLEATFGALTQIQETVNEMSKQTMINEEDLTLKLTNLPDEIDLDNVGIDLITDDDEVDGDEGAADADASSDGDELDLDFGGGDVDPDDASMGESAEIDDDTVVEIDETMLRAEIARLKGGLTESEHPANIIDDFGNGKAEGDPLLDADIGDTNEVGESVPSTVQTEGKDVKAAQAMVKHCTARILKLRKHLKETREKGNKRFETVVRKELGRTHQRLVEAQARLKNVVGETSPKNAVTENRTAQRPADNAEVQKLRKKLEEKNLYTAKLVACNKLLQNDGLTAKQKAQVIARLEEAKTPREAKLIYDSIARVFSKRGNVNEGTARTTGSSSRVTRSASTLNEQTGAAAGADVERWQVLAGLK